MPIASLSAALSSTAHAVVRLLSTSLGFDNQGGVIVLSSGDDEDVLGGAAVLTNSVFEGNHAGGGPGGVAYLNSFTMLNISGNSNR